MEQIDEIVYCSDLKWDTCYMVHRILRRDCISKQLNRIFHYPLTVVVAAMGYGKTTSVRDFLDEMNVKYIWLAVEGDETSPEYLWDSLTRQLAKKEPELGNQLNTLGFPTHAPLRDRILAIIEEIWLPSKKRKTI